MKRLTVLFFLFCLTSIKIIASYDLSICAIFQNEAPYLKEWIEFHRLQGVQHFFLYNNESTDDYKEVLRPYIKSKLVTLTQWKYKYKDGEGPDFVRKSQCKAYLDCIEKYKNATRWLACIDTDEFLFCPSGELLPSFLKRYEQYGGVCANWVMFGTSGIEVIPKGSLMIELLTMSRGVADPVVKSIVQPKKVAGCLTPHWFQYKKDNFAVDALGNRVREDTSPLAPIDHIRINHYWSRTEQFLREVKIPRCYHMYKYSAQTVNDRANSYNASEDTSILQFVPSLRKQMGISL
jgi:hypothetical protein